jgi:dihydroorotate dehydrogenase (fumarate)
MTDLTTSYLGLALKNPLIASASPLSKKVNTIQELAEAGISAIVLHSLFEEQIIQESLKLNRDLERGTNSYAESLEYFPDIGEFTLGADAYIEHLHNVRRMVNIPIIGSLNGISSGGWIEYAQKIEQAGADAIELNLYDVAADSSITSTELENRHIALVHDVRQRVRIPLAIKLSPFYTALPHFALRLVEAGADGLVLFNRFYQPDFNLEELEVEPHLVLSTSDELRLPLRWTAILYGRVKVDLALTSGVHTGEDVIKALMAGANVTAIASEFLKNGVGRATEICKEMTNWMVEHEYISVRQMIGSMSQRAMGNPEAFERGNYIKVLASY